MKKVWQSIPSLLALLLIPSFSFAQHGSGGAGALGAFVIAFIIFASIVAFLALVLLLINFRAYKGKAGRKSLVTGIFFSIILGIVSLWMTIADSGMYGYSLIGIVLSIASISNLTNASKKKLTYNNGNNDLLDDI